VFDVSLYVDPRSPAESACFALPEPHEVSKRRAVVATCIMAAKLFAAGVATGFFTHAFMDEAGPPWGAGTSWLRLGNGEAEGSVSAVAWGFCFVSHNQVGEQPSMAAQQGTQCGRPRDLTSPSTPTPIPRPPLPPYAHPQAGHAEEPVALAALAGLAGPKARVVLAGDPRQLGPVIHSRLARRHGLGVSWMERLMTRAPYAPSNKARPACGRRTGARASSRRLSTLPAGRARHVAAAHAPPLTPNP
jgi:hypothetical protein